jgi:hypothetical protein
MNGPEMNDFIACIGVFICAMLSTIAILLGVIADEIMKTKNKEPK